MFLTLIFEKKRITFNSQNGTHIMLVYKIEFIFPSPKIQDKDRGDDKKTKNNETKVFTAHKA